MLAMINRSVVWSFTLSLCLGEIAMSNEQRIVLRDYLKQQWTNELVTVPFSAKNGSCHEESVELNDPTGPLPVQLSEVKHWPGTKWVKSAKLSFIADLAPLAAETYTVRYGTKLVKAQ